MEVALNYGCLELFTKLPKTQRIEAIAMLIKCLDNTGEMEVFLNCIDSYLSSSPSTENRAEEIFSSQIKDNRSKVERKCSERIKPFSCEECDRQFKYKDHLKRHFTSIHKGTRIPCDLCNKQFSRNSHLKVHKSSAHEGLRYSCQLCDYNATTKDNLTRHNFKYHHDIKHCDYKLIKIHKAEPPKSKWKYTTKDLVNAYKEVLETGGKIPMISQKYNVPRQTLDNYVSGKNNIEKLFQKVNI